MHPILFEIAGIPLYAYGLMMACAFVAGTWWAEKRGEKYGIPKGAFADSAVPLLLSSLIGSKILYLITTPPNIHGTWGDLLQNLRGGFVFYGGVIAGAATAWWWCRKRGISILAYTDAAAPGLALAHGIGRIGCFLNGCCYGAAHAHGVVLPALGDGIPRYPVQLYETAVEFLIALSIGFIKPSKPEHRGRIFGFYLIAYAPARFILERFREDPRGGAFVGLSISQWISVLALVGGLFLAFAPRTKKF